MTLSGRRCRRLATLIVGHTDVIKREISHGCVTSHYLPLGGMTCADNGHIDANDLSIMASGIQPRRQWHHSLCTVYGHHWRIMGRIIKADFILYYCRICS